MTPCGNRKSCMVRIGVGGQFDRGPAVFNRTLAIYIYDLFPPVSFRCTPVAGGPLRLFSAMDATRRWWHNNKWPTTLLPKLVPPPVRVLNSAAVVAGCLPLSSSLFLSLPLSSSLFLSLPLSSSLPACCSSLLLNLSGR